MEKIEVDDRRLLGLDTIEVIGVKLLRPEAKIPVRQREGDACFDIYACADQWISPGEVAAIDCGFACEIPAGYKIMINGRSGLAKKGIFCHVGTVDENYKGELGTILVNLSGESYKVNAGDRVGQISLQKVILTEFTEVKELSESNRGTQGFGSSGR